MVSRQSSSAKAIRRGACVVVVLGISERTEPGVPDKTHPWSW